MVLALLSTGLSICGLPSKFHHHHSFSKLESSFRQFYGLLQVLCQPFQCLFKFCIFYDRFGIFAFSRAARNPFLGNSLDGF